MSRIFISHSSSDNAQACALRDWLAVNGWSDVFLDLDPRRGLIAGERWQEALTQAAHRCEAVIFVISPAWAASKWCLTEFLLAKSLGKRIFGVIVQPIDLSELPREMVGEFQIADLTMAGPKQAFVPIVPGAEASVEVQFTQDGLERMRCGLEQAGLDARTFPLRLDRPRYPGLRALDTDDAAIFFGRDADIVRGMDAIRRLRTGSKRILVILGASGAGKSSLLRAGLWPRLRRSDREFLVLPVLRPEDAPILGEEHGLVECLHRCAGPEHLGLGRNRAYWRKLLQDDGLATALDELRHAAHTRLIGSDKQQPVPAPLLILPVDQAEELFQADATEEAQVLLKELASVLRGGNILVVFAIRSDSYAHLQAASALEGLEQELYSLPPITKGAIKDVIEGPARREQEALGAKGLKIDPLLTERLLNDWSGADALPLLAFTLQRLVNDYGDDHLLELADYEQSGGLSGALEAAIDKAMRHASDHASLPQEPEAREDLIRRAFVPWLVMVDTQTRGPLRRLARFEQFPADTHALVQCLLDARLLGSHTRTENGQEVSFVEVAHEALLRQWPLLNRIIDQERDALSALNEVKRDAAAWDVAGRSDDALLHRGGRLNHANALLARNDLQNDLGEIGRVYLNACCAREAEAEEEARQQQERERAQIARTAKAQRRATAFLLVVVAIVAATAIGLTKIMQGINQRRSDTLANLAAQAYERKQFDLAVRFALAGMAGRESPMVGFNAAEAEAQLARATQRSKLRARFPHNDYVSSATFSPDGTRVVTASLDRTVRIWDAANGREVVSLRPVDEILSVDFNAAGTRIVTVSNDGTSRIWDATKGRPSAELPHSDLVTSAVFSLDGTRVVTTGLDATARIWDAANGNPLATLPHNYPVISAVISRDGRRIATAGLDPTVRIWDAASNTSVELQNDDWPQHTAFSPDSTRLVTTSGTTARIWEEDGDELSPPLPHDDRVRSVAFSPDGMRIVTASGKAAHIWEMTQGNKEPPTRTELPHEGKVYSAAFSPDGTRIITAADDEIARIWDMTSERKRVELLHGNPAFDTALRLKLEKSIHGASRDFKRRAREWFYDIHRANPAFSPDGTRVLTVVGTTAGIWDATSEHELVTLRGGWGPLAFSPDGQRIATVSGTVRLQEVISGQARELPHIDVNSIAFSADGKRLVTTSNDKTARIWDVASGHELARLLHDEGVTGAAISRDGARVITASADKSARIWDLARKLVIAEFRHGGSVNSVAFSPDGTRIVTASDDKAARIWDLADRGRPKKLLQHRGSVDSAVYSDDGTRIVTASLGHAYIWDADGRKLSELIPTGDIDRVMAVSNDGSRIATVFASVVHIWDAVSGREVARLEHDRSIISAAFNADGTRVATTAHDGFARVWNTEYAVALRGQALVDSACKKILSVDVDAAPFPNELSQLSPEELRLAPVLDPAIDADVCRPAGAWQRAKAMFGRH